jgi:hypothetical protein
MSSKALTDEQADVVLVALSREGFELPFMAHSRDYATSEELKAADDEAWRENRAALRRAFGSAVVAGPVSHG